MNDNDRYWGLAALAYLIRWLEELVAILSKPFLMLGFIISMVDLLTHGGLLAIPGIFFGWALIQAVAVDALFFVVWHKTAKDWRSRRVFPFMGHALLGLALGIVAWAAMDLQSLQQALTIGSGDALARLGLNPVMLTHVRSVVAVLVGMVVAMSSPEEHARVTPPRRFTWSIHWPQAFLDFLAQGRQITLFNPPVQPVQIEQPQEDPVEHPVPAQVEQEAPIHPAKTTRKQGVKSPGKSRAKLTVVPPPEQRVRDAYTGHPEMTTSELARRAGVSRQTATKWREVIDQERQQVESAM